VSEGTVSITKMMIMINQRKVKFTNGKIKMVKIMELKNRLIKTGTTNKPINGLIRLAKFMKFISGQI
jgi:hypothetical protein